MWKSKIYSYLTNSKIYKNTRNKVICRIAEHITVNYLLFSNDIFSPVHPSVYNSHANFKYNSHMTLSNNQDFNYIFELIT